MSQLKVVKVDKEKQPKAKRERKPLPKFALVTIMVVGIALLALMWSLPNLPKKPNAIANASYKGVIELWNVESFEGGAGSRGSWLTNKSAKFEAVNKGLFVHVTTLTEQELRQKLADNQSFDIVCFSRGAGDVVKELLAPMSVETKAVRENMLLAGQFDGKQYAVPLYAGGYCLFARTSQLPENELLEKALTQTYSRKIGKNTVELQPLICGFTSANSPLTALAMSGGHGDASALSESVTQYRAYEQFVANKTAVTLLGTQRDLYRLSQKEKDGKIESLGFCALSGYNDLVQFAGVSRNCGEKLDACEAYLQYLLSPETQSTLVNLCMFAVLDDVYYTDERYAMLEGGLSSSFVPNVFVGQDVVANQRSTAKATLKM